MGNKIIKLATWNIGAGILGESHQVDGEPELEYHASIIKQHSADIVCLQEAHEYEDEREGQVEHLGKVAGYPYVKSIKISPSHLAADAFLSLGIMSRFPIGATEYFEFPNPGFEAQGPNGAKWVLFDKGYSTSMIDINGAQVALVNAHCFPLHYFDANPTEARFAEMWTAFGKALLDLRQAAPVLAAIDLNFEDIHSLLGSILGSDRYLNAFGNTPTIPKGIQQDYVLYDSKMRLLETAVTPTEADHSYCQVTLQL